MVAFRKLSPVLAFFALTIGATSAFGQAGGPGSPFNCVATPGNPPLVRSEGYTELAGDLILTCTGGDPSAPILANFQVFLNTNITSRLISGTTTDALMIVDEAGSSAGRTLAEGGAGPSTPFCVAPVNGVGNSLAGRNASLQPNALTENAGAAVSSTNPTACNPAPTRQEVVNGQTVTRIVPAGPVTSGNTYQTGTFTVYYGQRLAEGIGAVRENAIVWAGVPVVPPGSNRQRSFRFTNIRANASGLGVSSTFLPTQLVANVSVFAASGGSPTVEQATQTIGFVAQGLAFDRRNRTIGDPSTGIDVCTNEPGSEFRPGGTLSGTGEINSFGLLRFREGFQNAFKIRVESTTQALGAGNPGQVFGNSESGFIDPLLQAPTGLADSGTRFAVRFTGVPANVRLFVGFNELQNPNGTAAGAGLGGGATAAPATGGTSTARAQFVNADVNGFGFSPMNAQGGLTSSAPSQGFIANTAISGVTAPRIPLVEVPVVNGTAVAVWEYVATDVNLATVNEELLFPFAVGYAQSGANVAGIGASTVTGSFAPFYTGDTAGRMSSLLPIPRFVQTTGGAGTAFEFRPCRTNLLFPYVTNWAGFDTGIAIANTSDDRAATSAGGSISSNTSTGRVQAGRCRMNYYGRLADGNAPTRLQETTDRDVAAGETITMVLSSGGGLGLQGNANFQGYIIAQCDFLYAHGFAFITDGPIGQARVAEGYLALVIDGPPGSGRLRGGESGESRGH